MHGCKRVEKTRSLHFFRSLDSRHGWILDTRDYSCSCIEFIEGNSDYACNNQELGYVGKWDTVPLVVSETYDEDEEERFEDIPLISIDYDHISGLVRKGTHVSFQ